MSEHVASTEGEILSALVEVLDRSNAKTYRKAKLVLEESEIFPNIAESVLV